MPGPLKAGTAYVEIRPSTTGFTQQLSKQLAPAVTTATKQITQATGPALSRGFTAAGKSVTGLADKISKLGRGAIFTGRTFTNYLTLPLVGLGALATKAALDFDTAFTRVGAITSLAGKNLEAMRGQVLALAGKTAQAPTDLANALYYVASAGLKANQIMPVLRNSAKAAAVGLGETQSIAQTLIFSLNNYAKSGLTATHATDLLVAAVKAGTAEPEAFAGALGRILPIASKAKVSFDQVVASLASLSNIGLDVNEGVTAMRGVLRSLLVPTASARDKLKELGLSADAVRGAIADKGLLGALQLLNKATGGNIDSLGKIIPNVRALTGAFGLLGENAPQVASVFDQVAHSTGALNRAFAVTEKSPAFQFRQSLVELQKVGIELGNVIIPIFVRDVAPVIKDLVTRFNGLSDGTKEMIVKFAALAAAIGPASLLVGGLLRLVALPIRIAGSLLTLAGSLAKVGASAAVAATAEGAAATSTTALGTAAVGAYGPLALIAAALFDVYAAWQLIDTIAKKRPTIVGDSAKDLFTQADAIARVADALYRLPKGYDAIGAAIIGNNQLTAKQSGQIVQLVYALNQMGGSLSRVQQQQVANLIATGGINGALAILRGQIAANTTGYNKLTSNVKTYSAALALARTAVGNHAAALTQKEAKALDAVLIRLDKNKVALNDNQHAAFLAAVASGHFHDALKILTGALADGKKKTDEKKAADDAGAEAAAHHAEKVNLLADAEERLHDKTITIRVNDLATGRIEAIQRLTIDDKYFTIHAASAGAPGQPGGVLGARGLVFTRTPKLAAGGVLMRGPAGDFVAGDGHYPTPVGRNAEIVSPEGVLPLGPRELNAIGDALWERRRGASMPVVIVTKVMLNRRELARAVDEARIWES